MKQTISPTIHLQVDERLFIAFNELRGVLEGTLREIYWLKLSERKKERGQSGARKCPVLKE